MVKLADRITNLQPPSKHWSKEKINDQRDEVKIILEELGHSNEHLTQSLDDNRDLLIPGMYIVLKMHLCKVVDTTFGCKTDKDIMVPRIKQLR